MTDICMQAYLRKHTVDMYPYGANDSNDSEQINDCAQR